MKRANRRWSVAGVLLGLILFLSAPGAANAHPHVFIDARVTFQFNGNSLQGFWAEWAFDELFTSMIVLDFNAPRQGSFSDSLIQEIHDGAFSNLQFYDYFTYVIVDGTTHTTATVEHFSAFMRDHRIVYRFFVPFGHPLDNRQRALRVRMYDHTFFTDIAFDRQRSVAVESELPLEYGHRVVRNQNVTIEYDNRNQSIQREGAVYTGLTHPWEIELHYRKR